VFLIWPVSHFLGIEILDQPVWLRLGIILGSLLASAGGGALLRYLLFERQLRRLIRQIERSFQRRLSLALTFRYWELLSEELLPGLVEQLDHRLSILFAARQELEEELERLEHELHQPAEETSFLREALFSADCLIDHLGGEDLQSEFPSELAASSPDAREDLRSLYTSASQRDQTQPPSASGFRSIADRLLHEIRHWIEIHLPLRVPEEMRLESFLLDPEARERLPDICAHDLRKSHRHLPLSSDTLWRDLYERARVFMPVIHERLQPHMPLTVNLAAMEQSIPSPLARAMPEELGLRCVPTMDPFAVSCLRTLHGLTLGALGTMEMAEDAFRNLPADTLQRIGLDPAWLDHDASPYSSSWVEGERLDVPQATTHTASS
jgi:hypothetical protein